MHHQYDRVFMDAEPLDFRTAVMLREVKQDGFEFSVPQGSYQQESEASAGTHTKGGVADLFYISGRGKDEFTRALKRKGFAVGHRTSEQGFDEHWHIVDLANDRLSFEADLQEGDYRNIGDMLWPLIGHDDPDPWRPDPIHGWSWDAWKKEQDLLARRTDLSDRIDDLQDRRKAVSRDLRKLRHHR